MDNVKNSNKENVMERLKQSVSLLPDEPGVYRFYNSDGVVIYVGKAKNLKKRVSSYFLAKNASERKVIALVRNIDKIEHIVVQNEADALLLENNMIKSFQPKYNILLKDDKTFPWIVVKHEAVPRILPTRELRRDGSKYYGPYTNITMQKSVLELVRSLYYIRTCNLPLTQQGIDNGKFQKCLEYHIGNCKAPCEGLQTLSEYIANVKSAEVILKGDMTQAEQYLRKQIDIAAVDMRFEEAHALKQRLDMLNGYQSKSVIVSPQYSNMDIFSLVTDSYNAYCNYLHIEKGAVINSYTVELKLRIEQSQEEVLSFAIEQIYQRLERRPAREVIVPFMPDNVDIYKSSKIYENVTFTVPQRGDKLKLLELSQKNSRLHRIEKLKHIENTNPERHVERILKQMQSDLMLDELPRHIECFDNSNIQGAYPVSACVVFRNARPSKKDYRHFNIKTVVGIDDFASMRETVLRRYSRMIEQGDDLPQLIVIDGGKGQLGMAYDVLKELGIENKIKIVGLAKRMEEIFFPNDPHPLCLDKTGETLKVLMHIRDEAHRFGITFHRNKRSAGFIQSELQTIPTLGEKSVMKLLKHFKTVSRIKKATITELSEVVGMQRAEAIVKWFLNER